MNYFSHFEINFNLREEKFGSDFDVGSKEDSNTLGSCNEVNFTLVFWVESWVKCIGNIGSIGIRESFGSASGQTGHDFSLLGLS